MYSFAIQDVIYSSEIKRLCCEFKLNSVKELSITLNPTKQLDFRLLSACFYTLKNRFCYTARLFYSVQVRV